MLMSYRYERDFPDGLDGVLLPVDTFAPLPRYEDADAWQSIPEKIRGEILLRAEECLSSPVIQPTATQYMHYFRTGERDYDQLIDQPARSNMLMLVCAECIERKGRFLDRLIDEIWALCERTSWVLPAHEWFGLEGGGGNDSTRPLPDAREFQIDLFAATNGEFLAWTWYIMGREFDKVSYLICDRIEYEMNRRILEPFYFRGDLWWKQSTTHNWHIWCTSNCLACILLMEKNPAKRAKGVELALRLTEQFYRDYVEDGSTIEGPMYWNVAAGSLYYALKLFKLASGGRIDFFDEPVVKNIATFLCKVHINGLDFLSYSYSQRCSDLFSRGNVGKFSNLACYAGDELYDYGKELGDAGLMALGAHIFRHRSSPIVMQYHAFTVFRQFLCTSEVANAPSGAPYVGYYWSDALQLSVAREHPGSVEGFYLAAKGYSGYSDGHLDGGEFTLDLDGKPVYIDLGNVVYDRSVIDERYRYGHFIVQTANHNSIVVNGCGHKVGMGLMPTKANIHSPEVLAASSRSRSSDDGTVASTVIDVGNLYPEEACVEQCVRTIILDRAAGEVRIGQKVVCGGQSLIELPLISNEKPVLSDGCILLKGTRLSYDKSVLRAREPEELDTGGDPYLRMNWGDHIYRTVLEAHTSALDTVFTVTRE